jgi:polar amino acid transport system permease protein
LGLVQARETPYLGRAARGFCTFIRGTPLLVQIWLLYHGFGQLFPGIPGLRQSFLWPILRDGYYYAVFALTISFAGYEGEVMRGAFLAVPKGELEAARAFGMSPWKVLRRIWFPRALRLALPTLAGETALQLQATPLAGTVAVMELYGVSNKIRQDTFRVYEPLLLVLIVYVTLYFFIVWAFHWYENRIPQRR